MSTKEYIGEVLPNVKIYRDKTGIAWAENGNTGMGHSVHANIDASGSVKGMKNLGYWGRKDRTIRSHGFIYNIDTFIISDAIDAIVASYCNCPSCIERRTKENVIGKKVQ